MGSIKKKVVVACMCYEWRASGPVFDSKIVLSYFSISDSHGLIPKSAKFLEFTGYIVIMIISAIMLKSSCNSS